MYDTTNSSFSKNTADYQGTGAFVKNYNTTITNSIFNDNFAFNWDACAIFTDCNYVYMINLTVTNNRASDELFYFVRIGYLYV